MEYIVHYSDDSEGYLAHYGVLGMKWGVRHDKERTARKVSNYVNKYNYKAQIARNKAKSYDKTIFGRSKTAKYAKYKAKSDKHAKKAENATTTKRLTSQQKKSLKYQKKAVRLTRSEVKAHNYNAKAYKYEFKAKRMQAAYAKELKRMQAKEIKRGKEICGAMMA